MGRPGRPLDCGLQHVGFLGNIVTWCNNRGHPDTIRKRLDMLVYNSDRFDGSNSTIVTHLANACSDHNPLLIRCKNEEARTIKYFKFQNFWTDHDDFLRVDPESWNTYVGGDYMWSFHVKLKKASSNLSKWSKDTFDNVHNESKRLGRKF
ncbi:hypothetical protein KY290_036749 [Solanum tuberosum]|uniref:Uncharacterized protein n=1 Tax=Solanum tuberosum TaxID=4113 RepID=A0ABQ7TUY4_SOLTU|nr:hypothetical protein KY290_036749 [Solanum tuberosum]